jgi:hypothetical protein
LKKRRDFNTGIAEGKSSGSDLAGSLLFSLETGAGIRGVSGGDWSAIGCFNLSNLPNSGQKENELIKLVNAVPNFIAISNRGRGEKEGPCERISGGYASFGEG